MKFKKIENLPRRKVNDTTAIRLDLVYVCKCKPLALSPVASTIGWTRANRAASASFLFFLSFLTGYLLLTIQEEEEEADHLEFKRQLCAPRQRNEGRHKKKNLMEAAV